MTQTSEHAFNPEAWLLRADDLGYRISLTPTGIVFSPKEARGINGIKDGKVLKEFNERFAALAAYLRNN